MAEDAGSADLISGGRLQLGISRGSPEQVIDGWHYFGYQPQDGQTDADMAREHAQVLHEVLRGNGFAQPNPRPMFATLLACCASSRTQKDCETASGGAPRHSGLRCGRPNWA
jgi:alkanesulfonate monooxygenase SsuD/methylene tetrahydromethanopterin reductase-like flavin-dependent oxidoreductase (luciferase family)